MILSNISKFVMLFFIIKLFIVYCFFIKLQKNKISNDSHRTYRTVINYHKMFTGSPRCSQADQDFRRHEKVQYIEEAKNLLPAFEKKGGSTT